MEIGDFTQYLPGIKDLTVPGILAMFYWLVKRAASPGIHWITHLLRSSRYRDLKLAKRYRVDPFSIQRQIAKEEALFCAFIVCTVVSLALLVASGGARTEAGRIIFIFQMLPVIALELWWLWQKAFVMVLLEESSRIGQGFKRVIPNRKPSESRLKQREERRARLAKKPKTHRHIGRRLV